MHIPEKPWPFYQVTRFFLIFDATEHQNSMHDALSKWVSNDLYLATGLQTDEDINETWIENPR